MRLVEYKGSDQGPDRIGFGPGLNLIGCRPFERVILINQIANSFPVASGAFDPKDAVITPADLEWILEGVDSAAIRNAERSAAELRAAFTKLTARELAANDALVRAEAEREMVLTELERVEEEEAYRSQSEEERVERELALQEMIHELTAKSSQALPDLTEIEQLLSASEWTQPWEDLEQIEELAHQLEQIQLAGRADESDENESSENRRSLAGEVPQWLVNQLEADLAEAHRQLDTILSDMVGHEPTSIEQRLETRARQGLQEAQDAWDELFEQAEEDPKVDTVLELTAVLQRIKGLFGLEFEDADSALNHVREYLDACKAPVQREQLREALDRVGLELTDDEDPQEVAQTLIGECAVLREEQETAARDLVRAREELANLHLWTEPSRLSIDKLRAQAEKTESHLELARRKHRDEMNAIESTRKMLADELHAAAAAEAARNEAANNDQTNNDQTNNDAEQQDVNSQATQVVRATFEDAFNAVREAASSDLPLLIDSAFDGLDATLRSVVFGALAQLDDLTQVLYFTENAEVLEWAQQWWENVREELAPSDVLISASQQ